MSLPPYQCHNRQPFKLAMHLYHLDAETLERREVVIPFRNSFDCNYTTTDLGQADPRCTGCSWRQKSP